MNIARGIIRVITNPFAKYELKLEPIVYLLIFLFPIAGMSINHWITSIFNILMLLGLFTLRSKDEALIREEKVFLWICAAYFSMFLIASLVNGWTDVQTRYMGTELRFLLVIPLYLLVRRYPDCVQWLLLGCIPAGFVLVAQSYYDISFKGLATGWGVYSRNLIGPFAVLVAFWGLHFFWHNRQQLKWSILVFILLSVICAMLTVGISGSRGAYVGFIVTAFFCVMFFSKPRWMFVSLLTVSLITVMFYQSSDIVKQRVDIAVDETQKYFQAEDHVKDYSSRTSSGLRLEMMRAGFMIIQDNPVFGIGPGNYKITADKYIKEGKVNFDIAGHGYPHNAFLEVATAKGLLGLLTLLLLLYYPCYIYIRDYKICKSTSTLGLIHIIALSVFSFTDHSVVLMNNYTSILLLGQVLFFSSHIHFCHRKNRLK